MHRIEYEEGSYSRVLALSHFYLRRALRILPLYFGIILLFTILGYTPIASQLFWHLTYTSNYGQMLGIDMANAEHFWSLCVEEQFYLLMPLVVLWTPINRIPRTILSLLVMSVCIKIFLGFYTQSWLLSTRGLHGNMEGLLMGMLMGTLNLFGISDAARKTLSVVTIIGILFFGIFQFAAGAYHGDFRAVLDNPYYIAMCDISISFMVSYPILCCVGWKASDCWVMNTLAYLGRISYGIYVYHYLLIPFVPLWFARVGLDLQSVDQGIMSFALSALIVICVAMLSWHLFECPILRFKERIKLPF